MKQKLKERIQAEMERTYHDAARAAAWDLVEKLDLEERARTIAGLEDIIELLIEEYWLDGVMGALAAVIERHSLGLPAAKGGRVASKLYQAITNDKFWDKVTDLAIALRIREGA